MNLSSRPITDQNERTLVSSRQLEGKLNTKSDWYNYLKYSLGYHLPSYKRTKMRFLKDVLSGNKELIKCSELLSVNVPNYPELSVENVFSQLKDDQVLSRYLNIYENDKEMPDRHFFYGVLATLRNDYLLQLVQNQQMIRLIGQKDEERKDVIEISKEILAEIESMPFYSSKCLYQSFNQILTFANRKKGKSAFSTQSQHIRKKAAKEEKKI